MNIIKTVLGQFARALVLGLILHLALWFVGARQAEGTTFLMLLGAAYIADALRQIIETLILEAMKAQLKANTDVRALTAAYIQKHGVDLPLMMGIAKLKREATTAQESKLVDDLIAMTEEALKHETLVQRNSRTRR